jgi:uncharacterized protein (TIGR03435 family)
VVFAQTDVQTPTNTLHFKTVTIQPSAPIPVDAKEAMARRIGVHIDGSEAVFGLMSLRDLILYAYGLKPLQLKGPDWLAEHPYDIAVTMPAGTTKDDVSKMLQALLETRFKLVVHRESKKQQVMALVIAKGGSKLVDSASVPPPVQGTPVQHYDTAVGTKDGPVYIYLNGHEGSTLRASMTMPQFAGLLTNLLHAGDNRGHPDVDMHEYSGDWQKVVDQTGLKGTYEVAVNSSLGPSDIVQRVAGSITVGGSVSQDMLENLGAPQITDALDPIVFGSIQKLGLKLELSKVAMEQLVVDHVEKTPTAN